MLKTEVLSHVGLTKMFTLLRQRRLRWPSHVLRMNDDRILTDLLYEKLADGKGDTGHPELPRRDDCKKNMKTLEINSDHWEDVSDGCFGGVE